MSNLTNVRLVPPSTAQSQNPRPGVRATTVRPVPPSTAQSRNSRAGVRRVPLSPPSTAESRPTGDKFGDNEAASTARSRSVLDVEGVAERAVQIGSNSEVEVANGLVVE